MAWGSATSATIRIALAGQRTAIAGLAATKAEVNSLRRSVAEYGATAEVSSKRSWLLNQALFTLRRYAYMGTLALTGLIGLSLKWGTSFNATMQSATLALQPMMKGTGDVQKELQILFNMAKYNPFTFGDMTTAFRRMYIGLHPIGIQTAEINRTLTDVVDALSAAGSTSPGQLNRVAVALQHLAYSGRLTGFAVNQLMRDGLPIVPALNKELGITGEQLHNISKLGIPAGVALDALNKYIEETPGLAGAAARQAKTLGGELATLHDNIAQTVGALTHGLFTRATGSGGFLQNINNMFNGIQAIILKQKGKISIGQVFGQMTKAWPMLKPILTDIKLLVGALTVLWNVIRYGVLPTLYLFATTLAFFYPILHPMLEVLKFLTKQMWLMVPVLTILTALYILDRYAMWRAVLVKKELKDMTYLEAFWTRQTVASKKLYVYWTLASARATRLWGIFMGRIWVQQGAGAFKSLTGLEKAVRTLGITIRTVLIPALADFGAASIAFLATPAGWVLLIVAAVILLVAGLVILYFKWKWFHNLVNTTFHWIWEHWKLMALVLAFLMPPLAILLVTARLLYDHWKTVDKFLTKFWRGTLLPIYKWLSGIWKTLVSTLKVGWEAILLVVNTITGVFKGMIKWIDKVIAKIKSMLGWWKKIPFATDIVGAAKGIWGAISGFAMQPGMLTPADAASPAGGGALGTPGSNISPFYPSVAAQSATKHQITNHVHVHIDGKQVATSVAKSNNKHKARK